ncbi:MAG TPA: hypothetical protein VFB43_09490 [Terracidiphilus sp.]|nr:hypothetical protein [Terracidiphilus sp.]
MSLLRAQSGGIVPVHKDDAADRFYDAVVPATQATMQLIPQGDGAHPGSVWIGYGDKGLSVTVLVHTSDNDLHWPREKSDMLAGDHVEIWLAAANTVSLPPVGWGSQFGTQTLASAADCSQLSDDFGSANFSGKNCVNWYNQQLAYRKQLEHLFVRQWLMAGVAVGNQGHSFEDFATTAYTSLKAGYFANELPEVLAPKENDGTRSFFQDQYRQETVGRDAADNPRTQSIETGYTFHFFIPYSAFPPTQQLDLRDLWLMVDVFAAAPEGRKMGALSTTAPHRVWGRSSSFNHLRLDSPRVHTITPCKASLVQHDLEGEDIPAWYFPLAGAGPLYLDTVYDIENPAGGYMYTPSGVSPIVATDRSFWKQLPDGAYICGPYLAYRKGPALKATKFIVDSKYFQTKQLADGWTLIRTGPDMSAQNPFGSGQCGAGPVLGFNIYALSPSGEITNVLQIDEEFRGFDNSPSGGDLAIAPDWSHVSLYEEQIEYVDNGKGGKKDTWTENRFCLQGHEYQKCSQQTGVTPPKPPNFPEINGDN